MADDLMRQHLQVGMPYTDVVTLLGPPDPHGPPEPGVLVYDLRTCGAMFPVDENFLVFIYDHRGPVTEIRMSEHWWP